MAQMLLVTRELHTSKVAGQFGGSKIVAYLQRYVFLPKMQQGLLEITSCVALANLR